jgi:hypothetical protein
MEFLLHCTWSVVGTQRRLAATHKFGSDKDDSGHAASIGSGSVRRE